MGGFVEFPHSGSVLLGCNLNHSFECISTIQMICPSIISLGNGLLSGCYILTNCPLSKAMLSGHYALGRHPWSKESCPDIMAFPNTQTSNSTQFAEEKVIEKLFVLCLNLLELANLGST